MSTKTNKDVPTGNADRVVEDALNHWKGAKMIETRSIFLKGMQLVEVLLLTEANELRRYEGITPTNSEDDWPPTKGAKPEKP